MYTNFIQGVAGIYGEEYNLRIETKERSDTPARYKGAKETVGGYYDFCSVMLPLDINKPTQ